jgi:hypothetical protein
MLFAQHLMNGGHGDRSFPPLPRQRVSHWRNARRQPRTSGQARFEKMRGSSKRPMSSHQVVARQVRARFDESFRVEQNATTEPCRIRNSAGHDENVTDVAHVDLSGAIVAPGDTLKMLVPFEGDNLCARSQIDRRIFFDPSNQIAGHARGCIVQDQSRA